MVTGLGIGGGAYPSGWGLGHDGSREIGYCVEAICDFPRCRAHIDRGLGYACGSRHQTMTGNGCAHYFCGRHEYYGSERREHLLSTHVRQLRRERREQAAELLRFRRLEINAEQARWRYRLWRFVPKSLHPRFDCAAFHADRIYYRGAAI